MDDPSKLEPSSPPFAEIGPEDGNINTTSSTVSGGSTSSTRVPENSVPSLPFELPQPPIIPQENNEEENTASRTINTWSKDHEITLLNTILGIKETGKYPFANYDRDIKGFYNAWIKWRGVYVDEDLFTYKLTELAERFFENKKNIGSGAYVYMDTNDGEIYRLSDLIWGEENI